MNITIIGTGYVGLVAGACFAKAGHNVISIDKNPEIITHLNNLKLPIFEPNLQKLVNKSFKENRLKFSNSYKEGCKNKIIFICVDTPSKENGKADLTNLKKVLNSLIKYIKPGTILITKSTVPVGTNNFIKEFFKKKISNPAMNLKFCSNPEFLREGSAVKDFLKPERIIIGCDSPAGRNIMKKIYSSLDKNFSKKIIYMSITSAELSKYAANAFLATKISFVNEIAKISDSVGANMHEIKMTLGSDSRIGNQFLDAGLGFGGSCFPKDLKALISLEKKFKLEPSIINSVFELNNSQINYFYAKIKKFYGQSLKNKNICLWGLSFKPNTDDIRESMAIQLVKKLSPKVKNIRLHDPVANNKAETELCLLNNLEFFDDMYSALDNADCLIIATEWEIFSTAKINKLYGLKDRIIFDARNVLDAKQLEKYNIIYKGIGC